MSLLRNLLLLCCLIALPFGLKGEEESDLVVLMKRMNRQFKVVRKDITRQRVSPTTVKAWDQFILLTEEAREMIPDIIVGDQQAILVYRDLMDQTLLKCHQFRKYVVTEEIDYGILKSLFLEIQNLRKKGHDLFR